MTIFIQIASYRDPELIHTIRNCLENANYPNNLTFCICWQRDETESLYEFEKDQRFIILDVPYNKTKGCCWARNQIQKEYTNQTYTLQLDSHHRFIKGWDTTLIDMYNNLVKKGHKKPLITGYIPSYEPDNDPAARVTIPWKITLSRITHEGHILFIPATIDNWESLNEPIPADFYSAHFAFTTGEFCKEVQHNPDLYFTGEEMNITIRAFTHGYDLFHPHIVIAWHEYTRKYRTKHWDECKDWNFLEKLSLHTYKKFIKNLLNDELFDFSYGIGKRPIQEYSQNTLIFESIYPVKKKKELFKRTFHIPPFENINFVFFGLHDIDNKELYRVDLVNNEKQLEVNTELSDKPHKYTILPYFKETGWGDKIETNL